MTMPPTWRERERKRERERTTKKLHLGGSLSHERSQKVFSISSDSIAILEGKKKKKISLC